MWKQAAIGVILFLACLGVLPAQAWEGKKDNKAVDDLERMDEWELCQEVDEVCNQAALPASEITMEGLDYLTTIRRAMQKRHGEELPLWFPEASTAIATHAQQHCPSAACVRLKAGRRAQHSPAADEEPAAQEQAPAPPLEER